MLYVCCTESAAQCNTIRAYCNARAATSERHTWLKPTYTTVLYTVLYCIWLARVLCCAVCVSAALLA